MLKDIFEDLDFIAKIPKDAKPNFSDKTFTFTNEWFPTIKRRLKSEQGEKGIMYVENLINNIDEIYKISDHDSQKLLKDKVLKSIIGFNNIVYTYKIDRQLEVAENYSSMIDKIKKINDNIDKIIKSKKQFFTYRPSIL